STPLIHCLRPFSAGPTATPDIYTLSLHDALPICEHTLTLVKSQYDFWNDTLLPAMEREGIRFPRRDTWTVKQQRWLQGYFRNERSEEHTSELQSRENLVCRLLLEKKKYNSNSESC